MGGQDCLKSKFKRSSCRTLAQGPLSGKPISISTKPTIIRMWPARKQPDTEVGLVRGF